MKAFIAICALWSGIAQADLASPMTSPVASEADVTDESATLVSPQEVAEDGISLMDQVVDWYNAGQDVTWAQAKGHYVGRCFSFDDPNKGKNALFAPLGVSNGPGFPQLPKVLADLTHRKGIPADHYDHLEKSSEAVKLLRPVYTDQYIRKYYGPVAEAPLAQLTDIEGNGRMDFEIRVRKSGDYLVVTTTNLISQKLNVNIMTKPKFAHAGDMVYACYYFKKLAD